MLLYSSSTIMAYELRGGAVERCLQKWKEMKMFIANVCLTDSLNVSRRNYY